MKTNSEMIEQIVRNNLNANDEFLMDVHRVDLEAIVSKKIDSEEFWRDQVAILVAYVARKYKCYTDVNTVKSIINDNVRQCIYNYIQDYMIDERLAEQLRLEGGEIEEAFFSKPYREANIRGQINYFLNNKFEEVFYDTISELCDQARENYEMLISIKPNW